MAPAKKGKAKKVGTKKATPKTERVYPRPGSLKEKAAALFKAGKSAEEARKELRGKATTFGSWWGEFRRRGLKVMAG